MDKLITKDANRVAFIISVTQDGGFSASKFLEVLAEFGFSAHQEQSGLFVASTPFVEIHTATFALSPSEERLKVFFQSNKPTGGSFDSVELDVSNNHKQMIIGEDNHYIKIMATELEKSGYQLMVTSQMFKN